MKESKNQFPMGSAVIIGLMFLAYIYTVLSLMGPVKFGGPNMIILSFMVLMIGVYLFNVWSKYTQFKNGKIDTAKFRFTIVGGFFLMVLVNFVGCFFEFAGMINHL